MKKIQYQPAIRLKLLDSRKDKDMIRMLESEQHGKRSLTWESSVPATVYLNCEDVVWKESASLTDQEKREILTDIIESELHIEFEDFDADFRNRGVDVTFDFKKVAPVKFNEGITRASQEVRMDIIYKGRLDFDFDIEDDPEQAEKALDAQMKRVSDEIWIIFHDQFGFDPVEQYPEEYGKFLKSAYCCVCNGTDYAPHGWGEKFKYPPQRGDLRVYGYDFD